MMRRRFAWIFAVTALLGAARAQESGERERQFVRALEIASSAKTPEDYRKSARILEDLAAGGLQNGSVYFNLGNAYMRAGEFGRAIRAYRKAQLCMPRHTYLQANLSQALANAPGRLAEPPAPGWKHVFFWHDWLSYPEKFLLAASAFVLGALLAAAGLLLRTRRLYWASGGVMLAALFFSADAVLAYQDLNYGQHAAVVTETVARKGMGESYEPAFTQPLKDGAEFTIQEHAGEWVLGHFEGIGDGWLRRDAVAE